MAETIIEVTPATRDGCVVRSDHVVPAKSSANKVGLLGWRQTARGSLPYYSPSANESWIKVYEVNGVAKVGWIALKYNGKAVATAKEIVINPLPTPDPEPIRPVRALVEMSDGSQWEGTNFTKQ